MTNNKGGSARTPPDHPLLCVVILIGLRKNKQESTGWEA
jgi:hypothetical protein